jgi:DNA mismatch repair ATPase MutS
MKLGSFPESIKDDECNKIDEIWRSLKCDSGFLEKYSYIEWDCLKFLNTHPSFLQAITLANMSAPVLSFLIPILFLIFPFIILKIQGIPITMNVYIKTLKEIAKHHFIGKTINSLQNFNITSFIYMIVAVSLYLYQIYQNYMACSRFYVNIYRINDHLMSLTTYIDYSINNMDRFISKFENLLSYKLFIEDMKIRLSHLKELYKEIADTAPFKISIYKIGEVGKLLKKYYILFENQDYGDALQYSFEFEGYLNNLKGVYANINNGRLSCAKFSNKNNQNENENIKYTKFIGQYYPTHTYPYAIPNDCQIENNLIITGPNASGKTTYLKTTMLNIIFSQQVGVGFYTSASIIPYTHIHSYLNIPDTSGRDSLFQAESRRCKEIIDLINNNQWGHHFAIFDELYSGTNPTEASKSAYAFLQYLAKKPNVDFILTTHYRTVCKKLKNTHRIQCLKMNAREHMNGQIEYTYQICPGISKIQGAIKVLKDMNYPDEIIQTIENM